MDDKKYECNCACGHSFLATKSIAQSMGALDAGHASCPSCKEFLNLTLDEENQKMILKTWDDYVKERMEADAKPSQTNVEPVLHADGGTF